MITIAKDFTWEMGHRLLEHKGLCKNPHGHSYKLRLILQGNTNISTDMLVDYYEIEQIVNEVLNKYNHAFVIADSDFVMKEFLLANNFKYIIVNKSPTAECLCDVLATEFVPKFRVYSNVTSLIVRIYETSDVYAEKEFLIN